MEDEKKEFDPAEFNPWEASEDVCWFALPQLEGRDRAETLHALGRFAFVRDDFQTAVTLADEAVGILEKLGDRRARW